MRSKFEEQITTALGLADVRLQTTHLTTIVRSLLQTSCLSLLEYWLAFDPDPDEFPESAIGDRIFHPSDGIYSQILETFLPRVRSLLWRSCAIRWHERSLGSTGQGEHRPLVSQVETWVRFRNERQGHGVPDLASSNQAMTWLPALARQILSGFADLIPTANSLGSLQIEPPQGPFVLESVVLRDGLPIVIRDIKERGSGFRVRYQLLHVDDAKDGTFDLPPASRLANLRTKHYDLYENRHISLSTGQHWRPTTNVPGRQTRVFEGRQVQLGSLSEWYSNLESRACLVYGEGGIGKTTLVLEFINGLLESPPSELGWAPALICYYSAKKTLWTATGLHHLRGVSPAIADAVRTLAQAIDQTLDSKWYADDALEVVNRTANLLGTVGLKRNDVLLILDNTETLARSSTEEPVIASLVTRIATKLARVLMTSRRRESVEAFPIRVEPMDEDTGTRLLDRLANEYEVKPLQMAGTASLRKFARRLSGRPLALDVFARYAALPGKSLEEAERLVMKDMGQELGRFLFEDAWNRLQESARSVFLVLTHLGDVVDGRAVGRVCAALGIAHDDFLEALEETRFGQILSYGSRYDLVISVEMHEFIARQFEELTQEMENRYRNIGTRAIREVQQLIQAEEEIVTDRVKQAFRTAAAKAAYAASRRGDFAEAKTWYEEAVVADSQNSALWERYAWFLGMRLGEHELGLRTVRRAIELAPSDPEPRFTAGLISARLGDIESCDAELKRAEANGKLSHACELQKARARLEAARRESRQSASSRLLRAGLSFVEKAKKIPANIDFREKHLRECRRIENLLRNELRRID